MGRFELLVIAGRREVEGRGEGAGLVPGSRSRRSRAAAQIDEAVIWAEARKVCVRGELDLANVDALQGLLANAVGSGVYCIVLDLSSCEFLDAGALGVIIRTQCNLAANGQELVIDGANGQVARLIELARAISPQMRVDATR